MAHRFSECQDTGTAIKRLCAASLALLHFIEHHSSLSRVISGGNSHHAAGQCGNFDHRRAVSAMYSVLVARGADYHRTLCLRLPIPRTHLGGLGITLC